ncbi:NYN domain-containing protein [Desulfobacula sp.]|uniref:NYN domain-containing protein n=1 Tax=Candidatus Desulfatibia vada TaxID=2841696 RepID=A0A8J6TM63_9BACT|nr:NYN domain-containing protein [Candidatus Desulfatibia vada]MBL6996530.1 NYN domain-containing protein [Desulfobacula sp.]
MPERIRIFIDFWNFQLQWNATAKDKKIDWKILTQTLLDETSKITKINNYQYNGCKVYTSINMDTQEGGKLKGWLKTFLDRQPGINIEIRERKPHLKPIHCRECHQNIDDCPRCDKPIKRAVEKGVDAAIITDMFSLAWADAYTVAILVTSDADYVPAVENLQAKGFKIINATWENIGYQLAGTCWASFNIDKLVPKLTRSYR